MSWRDWALLLATAAAFASSLPFNRVIVGEIGPITLAFLRALTALPLLAAILLATGGRLPRTLSEAGPALLAGLLLVAIPFAAIAWGQQHIPSGLGGILYATMPLFTILIAHVLVADEKMNAGKAAGVGLGMIGVVIVIGPDVLLESVLAGGLGRGIEGELVTLVAPLSYALGMVYLRRHRHLHPIALMNLMFLAATVALVPIAFALEEPLAMRPAVPTLVALGGLALVGTALPALLNYLLIRRVSATNASLTMFFMPLFAVAYGAVLLAESLAPQAFLGMGLIIMGSLFVTRPVVATKPQGGE